MCKVCLCCRCLLEESKHCSEEHCRRVTHVCRSSWDIKYQLDMQLQTVTLVPMFGERLLCYLCLPDNNTLLQNGAKTVVCLRGWIMSSPVLANVRETCRCYGSGHEGFAFGLLICSSSPPSVPSQETKSHLGKSW